MKITDLQKHWDSFGKDNPMWAILTDSKSWDEKAFFETGVQEINALLGYVESLGINVPKRKALDFGCGIGRLSQALVGHFDEVCGVDIAPSMIEAAKEHNKHGERCNYYLNSRDDLTLFADNTFDLIYSNITLQHMAPRYSKNYIAEFIRILAPGGLLVFQLPSELVENDSKKAIKSILPKPILGLYRDTKLRFVDLSKRQPRMEMYGIEKSEVQKLIEEHNGKIVDAQLDERPTANASWTCYIYCVTKA